MLLSLLLQGTASFVNKGKDYKDLHISFDNPEN